MKITNKIHSFFISSEVPSNGRPRVFRSPVTINAKTALSLINRQLESKNKPKIVKPFLHVCYDEGSRAVYVLNLNEFTQKLGDYLINFAKSEISKIFGGFSNMEIIHGSPFSSLRVRDIDSFHYTRDAIEKEVGKDRFVKIPIIEANLGRMPKTLKTLPAIFANPNYHGGFVGPNDVETVDFIDDYDASGKKSSSSKIVHSQKTPFILINIGSNPKSSEKEWVVLSAYQEFFSKDGVASIDVISHSMRQHLYWGWTFEEVCYFFLSSVKTMTSLFIAGKEILKNVYQLKSEGQSIELYPYYITFKIDPKRFALDLESIMTNGQIDSSKQIPFFRVIEYDEEESTVIIETPLYLSEELCLKVLGAKNQPLITKYNPMSKNIEVKSRPSSLSKYKNEGNQVKKLMALTKYDLNKRGKFQKGDKLEFEANQRTYSIGTSDTGQFYIRSINDYPYAKEHIVKVCEERGIEFKDFNVLIGPIHRLFGEGTSGGFMSEKSFKDHNYPIPLNVDGVKLYPPIIAIDSSENPHYAEHTPILVHEYSHYLYNVSNPDYTHEYNKDPKLSKENPDKFWWLYLTDPDEIQAHKNEIKIELLSGYSPDEIIRNKVRGEITLSNYPIALKMRELVDAVLKEMEDENKDEEPA